MSGRYLKEPPKRRGPKVWLIILLVVVLLLAALGIGVYIYYRSMLNLVTTPPPVEFTNPTTMATEQPEDTVETEPSETEETVPEDTWPEIISTQNVTNIMLVGQNYRPGEAHKLSDTMILCSINRETNTLTMTSFLRDTYVPIPAYAGHGPGRNRINVCYNLGWKWTGENSRGGMEMLALCVEQNFGIPVDHTVEISFESFEKIIDLLGGVMIDLTEAEAKYMTEEIGYVGSFDPGYQKLWGWEALAYARIRKIDGDFQRTNRQRNVINSLIEQCKGKNLMDLHKLATEILPMIITDMTTDEMNNYIWEFLPMLLDLNIVSQSVPLDKEALGQWSYQGKYVEAVGGYVLDINLPAHRKYLQEQLGFTDADLE